MQGKIKTCSGDVSDETSVIPRLSSISIKCSPVSVDFIWPRVASSGDIKDPWIHGHFVLGSHARHDENLFRSGSPDFQSNFIWFASRARLRYV